MSYQVPEKKYVICYFSDLLWLTPCHCLIFLIMAAGKSSIDKKMKHRQKQQSNHILNY